MGLPQWLNGKESTRNAEPQETWVQSLGREDPLEKEMATHSSILAWKSHGQRSLVGNSPWGHKRAGHDLATKQQLYLNDSPAQKHHNNLWL